MEDIDSTNLTYLEDTLNDDPVLEDIDNAIILEKIIKKYKRERPSKRDGPIPLYYEDIPFKKSYDSDEDYDKDRGSYEIDILGE